MKKIFVILGLILIGVTNAHAAFYFNLNGTGRLVVSKDQSQAVFIMNGKQAIRYDAINTLKDQLDDGGRPYTMMIFFPTACKGPPGTCSIPALAIKSYSDKLGGFYIWTTDVNGKVTWQEQLSVDKISSDEG